MIRWPFKSTDERDRHIVDFVVATVRHCEQETSLDRQHWKKAEDLFNGIQNWGGDEETEEWMSRLFLHEFAPIIRQAATAAQAAIFQRPNLISITQKEGGDPNFASIVEKLNRHYIKQIGLKNRFLEYCLAGGIYGFATWKNTVTHEVKYTPEVVIERLGQQEEDFLAGLAEGVEGGKDYVVYDDPTAIGKGLMEALGQIFGGGEQYKPPEVKAKKRLDFGFNLRLINPFHFFWQPDCEDINKSPFTVERIMRKFFELVPDFESKSFDPSKKEKMMSEGSTKMMGSSGYASSPEMLKIRQRNQHSARSSYFKDVELLEYFGPLILKGGDIPKGFEHCHFVVGNGRHVLKCEFNPYWNQKPPYITGVFSRKPFKQIGAGIADGAMNQQEIINHLFSLYVDQLTLDIHSPRTFNSDMIADESELEGGIRPGQLIQVYGSGKAEDAFGAIPRGTNTAAEVYQVVEKLSLSGQKGSQMGTTTSNPASRARISAKEIESNDSRSQQSVNMLSEEIDDNCIVPLAESVNMGILQFGLDRNNIERLRASGIITDAELEIVMQMSPIQRFEEATKHYELSVSGFRDAMQRQERLARLNEWSVTLTRLPPQAQQSIDWKAFVRKLTEEYGFRPDEFIIQNTPQDKAGEENNLLKLDQQISIAQDDVDVAHLPVHYQAMIEFGVTQAFILHVQGHIQRAMMSGQQVPPPPPELAEVLGFAQEGNEGGEYVQ